MGESETVKISDIPVWMVNISLFWVCDISSGPGQADSAARSHNAFDPNINLNSNSLVTRIDDWLPQTQCGQCGYPRCRDYAIALAHGEASINQCPPGNSITIAGLAELLDLPVTGLDPAFGFHRARTLAVIDESLCIGCKLCIEACPVDAIVGAAKTMHTVVSVECTGCELCLPPCPMDCIQLIPWSDDDHEAGRWPDYPAMQVARAQQRVQARSERLAKNSPGNMKHKNRPATSESSIPDRNTIRREIQEAVARVREKKKETRENK